MIFAYRSNGLIRQLSTLPNGPNGVLKYQRHFRGRAHFGRQTLPLFSTNLITDAKANMATRLHQFASGLIKPLAGPMVVLGVFLPLATLLTL